jgi:hypothetical protein
MRVQTVIDDDVGSVSLKPVAWWARVEGATETRRVRSGSDASWGGRPVSGWPGNWIGR